MKQLNSRRDGEGGEGGVATAAYTVPFVGVIATKLVFQTGILPNTDTLITIPTPSIDTDGFYDAGTPSRFTIQRYGFYRIGTQMQTLPTIAIVTQPEVWTWILLNGTSIESRYRHPLPVVGPTQDYCRQWHYTELELFVDDYIEFWVRHNHSANMQTQGHFAMYWQEIPAA